MSRTRTLHTCSHHSRFFHSIFKIAFLVRTRVQSIAFQTRNFDFESSFAVLFESTIKPQREAQNGPSEVILLNIAGEFQ